MTETQIVHCGQPMFASRFGPHDETTHYRLQPIWLCLCGEWGPRDGWQGPLPDGWDEHIRTWNS